jgi:hypothetical protein
LRVFWPAFTCVTRSRILSRSASANAAVLDALLLILTPQSALFEEQLGLTLADGARSAIGPILFMATTLSLTIELTRQIDKEIPAAAALADREVPAR